MQVLHEPIDPIVRFSTASTLQPPAQPSFESRTRGLEPGVVGFVAIVEPHPDPNMKFLGWMDSELLRRPGRAGETGHGGHRAGVGSATCARPVVEEDGGYSGSLDDSVIEEIEEYSVLSRLACLVLLT